MYIPDFYLQSELACQTAFHEGLIYLDDIRPTPEGFHIRANNYAECIYFLEKFNGEIQLLSLDHDLGELEGMEVESGYDVMCWIEEQVHTNPEFSLPARILVHSSNPAGRQNMQRVINKLYPRD